MGRESRFDDFVRAFQTFRPTGNREADLQQLLEHALRLGAGDRGHAILMKKNTVSVEVARTRDGGTFEVEDEVRKAAARHGIAAQEGDVLAVERVDGRVTIPFAFNDKEGVALTLMGPPAEDGTDVGLAFAWAASQWMALAEKARIANDRVGEAESALTKGGVGGVAYLKPVAELERDAIELALKATGWNKEEAARKLGISRASIYMKVKKFGLQHAPPTPKESEEGE